MNLEKGKPFLSDEEKFRIAENVKNKQYYENRYLYNFGTDENNKFVKTKNIIPCMSTVSTIFSDLLYGDFPLITSENEIDSDTIQKWINDNYEIKTDLLESASFLSSQGTMFWKLYRKNDKIFWEFIPASNAVVEEDESGIIWFAKFQLIKADIKNMENIYYVEIHKYEDAEDKMGYTVEYLNVFENTVDKTVKRIDVVSDPEKPEIKEIPIIKIINQGELNSKFGKSDYSGLHEMVEQLDRRMFDIDRVLKKHSDPWEFVPHGIINRKTNTWKTYSSKTVEKTASPNGDNSVEYSIWDASLQAQYENINILIRNIFQAAGISRPLSGIDDTGGQVDSARALKWRSIPTFAKINRKRKYQETAICDFFYHMKELDNTLSKIDESKIKFEWFDGIPMDYEAKIDMTVKLVQNQLQSKLSAIQSIDEVDEMSAQKELDRINAEQLDEKEREASTFNIGSAL